MASVFRLDSVLLFILVIPFIMSVRISPGETPYWLFGLIFFGLLSYLVLDIMSISKSTYLKLKEGLLWCMIVLVIGSAFASAIIVRHINHPTYQIHDMPLQQEIAIRYTLDGKNPYATTYFGTFLEQWHYSDTEKNPALYHFVLLPFYILFAIPFYFLSNHTIGYFDARIPLLFLFFSILLLSRLLIKDNEKRRLFLTLFSFNPAMLMYMLEGRSDIFMFAFFFFGLFLLYRKRFLLAGVPLALAFAVKQSVWPFFPIYAAYLYFQTKNIKSTIVAFIPFIAVFLLVVLPFFLWDQKAFLDSTILYLSGSTVNSYPISGYGFGKFLQEVGVITDPQKYYPFIIWQVVVGIPILFILLRFIRKKATITRLIISYGIFLFIFWYFSRYFNNSHLGYLSIVFLTAYFWPEDQLK